MEIRRKDQPDGKALLELVPTRSGEARPPLSQFLLDAALDRVPGDRLAIAGALIFQKYFRGMVTVPKAVSPRMAAHLSRFREPVWCVVGPVQDAATEFAGRGTTVVLDFEGAGWSAKNELAASHVVVVGILPGDKWSGRLFNMDRLAVASNAWLFDSGEDVVSALGPYIGAVLLLAADLECSRLVVPHNRQPHPAWEGQVTTLMSAVGISLEFCEPADVEHLVRTPGAARVR